VPTIPLRRDNDSTLKQVLFGKISTQLQVLANVTLLGLSTISSKSVVYTGHKGKNQVTLIITSYAIRTKNTHTFFINALI